MTTFDYDEFPPPRDLEALVCCLWFMRASARNASTMPQRVLPDGCVEIVFNLADRFLALDAAGSVEPRPRELVVGPTTRHVRIQPTGSVDLVGVRLRPAAAAAFIASAPSELRDRVAMLKDVARSVSGDLAERLWAAQSVRARYGLIVGAMRGVAEAWTLDARVEGACNLIEATAGRVAIGRVARFCGVSPRSLERLFIRHVGIPPKLLARMIRLQRVLKSVQDSDLLGTALDLGYYDQPHFLRDFRSFAGVSPTKFFRKEANYMSEAFARPGFE